MNLKRRMLFKQVGPLLSSGCGDGDVTSETIVTNNMEQAN